MQKKGGVLLGAITVGKGTQATLLEQRLQFFHLESTAVIRRWFAEHPNDPITIEQKAKIKRGEIVDPPIILRWMREAITTLVDQGKNIVLSGSPRSRFEAEGDEQSEGLYPLLSRLYGKEHVHTAHLFITEERAVQRSKVRLVCVAHDHPVPDTPEYAEFRQKMICPWDGSPLQRRIDGLDDDEKIIRKRYREYMERLVPIREYLREQQYPVTEINGDDTVENIFSEIVTTWDLK